MAEGNCERWRDTGRMPETRKAELLRSRYQTCLSWEGEMEGGRERERERGREASTPTLISTTERPWSKEGMKARAGFGA